MEKLQVILASKTLELSEHDTYLELLNRVCYYTQPNGNGVLLPMEDNTAEIAQTLVSMPVYAKYTTNAKGEPTFRGHEVSIDQAGNVTFGTTPIGTHTEVYIQDDTITTYSGETMTLPCLFARQRIWTRNRNAVAAAKRLYSEGKLYNSWELNVSEYQYKDGTKVLAKYVFEGNTFLGYETASPAYGSSATVLSLSGEGDENELLVAEAVAKDMIENSGEEENMHIEKDGNPAALDTEIQVPNVSEITEVVQEKASLTDWDLRMLINSACRAKLDRWCWASFWFPEEHKVWCEYDGRESELDYLVFTYTVSEDDAVEVSDPVPVKLVVSPVAINDRISELNETIIELNSKIETLNSTVSELEPYRAAHEQAENERLRREHEAAVAELKAYVTDSKRFTQDEIDSDDIKALVEKLDMATLKSMIADRIVAESRKPKQPETAQIKTPAITVQPVIIPSEVDIAPRVNEFRNFLKG